MRVSAALEAREIDPPSACCSPITRACSASCCSASTTAPTARDWQSATPTIGRRLTSARSSRAALALAAPTASLLNNVQRVLERLDRAALTAWLRLIIMPCPSWCAAPTSAIVPQMFADAGGGRDLASGSQPDGTSYDVMMVWHQSVNVATRRSAGCASRCHLFGQGRIAANEPVDCASLA